LLYDNIIRFVSFTGPEKCFNLYHPLVKILCRKPAQQELDNHLPLIFQVLIALVSYHQVVMQLLSGPVFAKNNLYAYNKMLYANYSTDLM
jgi:hypothetical protein